MFIPPFCPSPSCPNFRDPPQDCQWYVANGSYTTKSFGVIQVFRCSCCRKTFSYKTFHLEYWVHHRISLNRIFNGTVSGSGLRQMGRELGVTDKVIANRQTRLARQAIEIQAKANGLLKVRENWVFDGFESFVHSQFFPNNIHILASKDSQYLWSTNLAKLRRKGRMTAAQKLKRSVLETNWKADRKELRVRSEELLGEARRRGRQVAGAGLTLVSDEKREYASSWTGPDLEHHRVSSAKTRNLTNPLFTVNYLDRELRKDMAEHTRETVRFARRVQRCLERLAIKQVHHNFIKPYRINTQAHNWGRAETHAQAAGLERETLDQLLEAFWTVRAWGEKQVLKPWEARVWTRQEPTPMFNDGWCARFLTRM